MILADTCSRRGVKTCLRMDIISEVRRMGLRQFFEQGVAFGLVVASALFLWNVCVVLSGCESPIVVAISGSMEPAFQRGDILFLTHQSAFLPKMEYMPGDIIAYNNDSEIAIVHRMHHYFESRSANITSQFLSKGDNKITNRVNDRGLYPDNLQFLDDSRILGRIRALFPYVGIFTIWLNGFFFNLTPTFNIFPEYPFLKVALIAVSALCVLTSNK